MRRDGPHVVRISRQKKAREERVLVVFEYLGKRSLERRIKDPGVVRVYGLEGDR